MEVKTGKDKISEAQQWIHYALKSFGIPVYVLSPDEFKNNLRGKSFITSAEVTKSKTIVENLEYELRRKLAEVEKIKQEIDTATFMIEENADLGLILKQPGCYDAIAKLENGQLVYDRDATARMRLSDCLGHAD